MKPCERRFHFEICQNQTNQVSEVQYLALAICKVCLGLTFPNLGATGQVTVNKQTISFLELRFGNKIRGVKLSCKRNNWSKWKDACYKNLGG